MLIKFYFYNGFLRSIVEFICFYGNGLFVKRIWPNKTYSLYTAGKPVIFVLAFFETGVLDKVNGMRLFFRLIFNAKMPEW